MNESVVKSKTALLFRSGLSLARKGNAAVAMDAYRRVLALVPTHAGASMQLAAALASQGQLAESCDVLRVFTQTSPDDVGAHYRLGLTLARSGDHAGAEEAFSRVIEIDPDHSGAPAHRNAALGQMQRSATVLERAGQLPEAVELLRAIAKAKPEDGAASYRLGLALARFGDEVEAERAFAHVLALDPDHAGAPVHRAAALARMSGLATTLERGGKLAEAVHHLRAIAKAKPDDVAAQHRLGLALVRFGNDVDAEAAFARVLELDPAHCDAPVHRAAALGRMGGLATTLERAGKLSEAIDCLRAIAKAKPDDGAAHYRLGLALTRTGDPIGAEASLARVLELDPGHAKAPLHHAAALRNIGRLAAALEREGDAKEAIRLLRMVAQAKPDDADAHYRLGLALARQGDPVGAEGMFARVLELDPTHTNADVHRAAAFSHMRRLADGAETDGQIAKAVEILRAITKSNVQDVEAHYRLGLVLARANDHPGAEAALAQVLLLDPDHAGAQAHRAAAVERMGRIAATLEREGRLAEAAGLLRTVTKALPDDVGFHYRLGLLLERLDDPVGAGTAFSRVIELDASHAGALARHAVTLGRMSRRATMLERDGRLVEAVDVLRAVIRAKPDDVRSLHHLGTVLGRLGENATAEVVLARVLALEPDHASAPVQLAAVLGRLERFENAAEVLHAAAQARPDNAELHYRLGHILARLRDYTGAKAAYERVLAIDPGHAGALSRLAATTAMLALTGAAAGNEPALRRMVNINPANVDTRLQLFDLLQRTRRYSEAVIIGQEHLDSQPYDPRISKRMGQLEFLRGNPNLAEAHYRVILKEAPDDSGTLRLLATMVYRQGRHEEARQLHARLVELKRANMPRSLKQGLYDVAEAIAPATSSGGPLLGKLLGRRSAIPDRQEWSSEQRMRWGRRVHQLFFDWGCFQPDGLADIRDIVEPPEWRAFKRGASSGAIFAGSHLGSYMGAVAHVAGSGFDYRIISANPEFIMSLPERTVDAWAHGHRALTRFVSFLRKGGVVYLAGDGHVGKKFDTQFTYENYRTRFPIGLPAMAYFAKVPVFWCSSVWRGRSMTLEMVEGPRAASGETLESWYERWFAFYWEQIREALASGPENLSRGQFERLNMSRTV